MLTDAETSVLNECVLNGKGVSAVYLCDFMTFDGQRFFISANLRTTRVRMEPVPNEAFEQFIRNLLSIAEDGELPEGRLPKASEVSA